MNLLTPSSTLDSVAKSESESLTQAGEVKENIVFQSTRPSLLEPEPPLEALPLPLIDSLGSAFRALSKVVQERRTRHASLNQLNGLRSYFEKLKQNLKALFEFDLVSAAAYSHLTVQAFEFVDKFADAVKVSEAREQEIIAVVFKHWLGDPLVLKGAEGEVPVNCWRIRMSYN